VTYSRSKVEAPKQKEISVKGTAVSSTKHPIKIDVTELAAEENDNSNVEPTSYEPISDDEWNDIEKQLIESGNISLEDDFSASTENLGYDPSEVAEEASKNINEKDVK
jgi:hypothetical protein